MNGNVSIKDVQATAEKSSKELATEMLTNIQQFLKGGWSNIQPDDLSIRKITGGYCNVVYCVERPRANSEDEDVADNPYRILYRQYGGTKLGNYIRQSSVTTVNNETQETLIFYESGRAGRAPQIYGVFAGGRIEEFIDGHTMREEELSDPDILKHAGEAFAAFHALRPPLPDNSQSLIEKLAEQTAPEVIDKARADLSKSHPHMNQDFLDVHLDEGREWLLRTIPKIESPVVLTHFDNNLLNVMVRDEPVSDQKKVLLIDYEMSKYMFRFYDLGCFFVNKTLKWDGKDTKVSGSAYPTAEERKLLLQAYIREIDRQPRYPQVDDARTNSLAHVMLEADVGALVVCVMMADRMRRVAGQLVHVEESFLTLIPHMNNQFLILKKEFEEKYPHFE